MGTILAPLLESAVAEFGPALLSAGRALLGGVATGAVGSVAGDASKDDSKSTPAVRALPQIGESCRKCPPEQTGLAVKRSHYMKPTPREYQGRITGRPFSVPDGWSEEWAWMNVDFDGFKREACLLQEAKANYDQFLDEDGEPKFFFSGFTGVIKQVTLQAQTVKANPPAKLLWYFMTPGTREYLLPVLERIGVPSVYQP
ncbi:restriction endonuclease fold toxin 5 of polymorphic toxin system [Paraburkholderia sp. BL21I4N1]|nr:restriction endonuclease fold toxin 5 of polymorphic toxin system [Paraburkholderia sp. BL21I4N1]